MVLEVCVGNCIGSSGMVLEKLVRKHGVQIVVSVGESFFLCERVGAVSGRERVGGARKLSISVLHVLMMCTASYVNFES